MVAVKGVKHPHKGHSLSEETKRKIAESRRGKPASEETKKKMSDARKGNKYALGHKHTDETKKKISESHLGKRPTEEARKRMSGAQKGRTFSEETIKRMSDAHKGQKHVGRPLTDAQKKAIRDANTGRVPSEETRRKISEAGMGRPNAYKGKHLPEWWRQKISEANKGERNGRWLGGKSFEPYCEKFNKQLKEQIREDFGRTCFLCGIAEADYKRKLRVHHCDYNKGQGCGRAWSLIPLCGPCHAKTNFKRYHWFNLLSNYWALKYLKGENFDKFCELCGVGGAMFL